MNWIELIVAWLPFVILIGVWVYFMRRQGFVGKGMSYATYLEEMLKETRRQNEVLERLLAEMKQRVERLEGKQAGP